MDRYICLHGHFYQPPRENPWLELVEQQDGAYPYHDWNERITAECYAPNARARILDHQGRITRLVNNYARLSFNVGPTLLAWLETASPDTYAAILDADRRSQKRFDGHGSAMAQVYNHAIMPLASVRDRRTQVGWGIADFRRRFGRDPEGMWLAETAVDDDTLDLLAEHGITFTVLSPYQAARVRPIGGGSWYEVHGGRVDPTMPYLVRLASGRSITVFFYDGPISRAVAFEGLLESAERFEQRLLSGFNGRPGPQLMHIATDGESYGHHHRHGEMALAATLQRLADRDDVQVVNYAQFLALHPPTHEAQVIESSSWSCAHGVERWRSDCGCTSGGPETHQRWRAPLRDALDWLAAELETRYEDKASQLLVDPWQARDDYIEVVLDRSEDSLNRFFSRHQRRALTEDERVRALHLIEMQRQSLLMYTSCGWFFEELSRPEPVQVLLYAARALQLCRRIDEYDDEVADDVSCELEEGFLARLEKAPSNDPRYVDGRGVWEHKVRPALTELDQVSAHFAISSLSWSYGETERIGAYEVQQHDSDVSDAGRAKLASGRLRVRSEVTHSSRDIEFGVLHLGDHNFACGVRTRGEDEAYEQMRADLERHFRTADFPAVIRAIDRHFQGRRYSLRSLFRDEQRRILNNVLATTVQETEAAYRAIYRGRAPLMRYLTELGAVLPAPLRSAAENVLNADLRDALSHVAIDPNHVEGLLHEARRYDIPLDETGLGHRLSKTVSTMARRLAETMAEVDHSVLFARLDDTHLETIDRIRALIEVVQRVPFEVDLVTAQDVLWSTLRTHQDRLSERAATGDPVAARWIVELGTIAEVLGVVPPALPAPVRPVSVPPAAPAS